MLEEVRRTEDEEFEPAERLQITDLETVKVLSDPLRLQIIEELLAGPRTVKQIAAQLGATPTKLYYHINMLEEHGLIKVVSTRVVSGIIEKQYRVAAYSFDLDNKLLSPSGEGMSSSVNDLLRTIFDGARIDLNKSIKAGLVDLSHTSHGVQASQEPSDQVEEEAEDGANNFILVRNVLQLPPSRVREFYKRVSALLKELNEATGDEEASTVHSILIAMYPSTHAVPATQQNKHKATGQPETGQSTGD